MSLSLLQHRIFARCPSYSIERTALGQHEKLSEAETTEEDGLRPLDARG